MSFSHESLAALHFSSATCSTVSVFFLMADSDLRNVLTSLSFASPAAIALFSSSPCLRDDAMRASNCWRMSSSNVVMPHFRQASLAVSSASATDLSLS